MKVILASAAFLLIKGIGDVHSLHFSLNLFHALVDEKELSNGAGFKKWLKQHAVPRSD